MLRTILGLVTTLNRVNLLKIYTVRWQRKNVQAGVWQDMALLVGSHCWVPLGDRFCIAKWGKKSKPGRVKQYPSTQALTNSLMLTLHKPTKPKRKVFKEKSVLYMGYIGPFIRPVFNNFLNTALSLYSCVCTYFNPENSFWHEEYRLSFYREQKRKQRIQ